MIGKKVFYFIFIYKSYFIYLLINLYENEDKGKNKYLVVLDMK